MEKVKKEYAFNKNGDKLSFYTDASTVLVGELPLDEYLSKLRGNISSGSGGSSGPNLEDLEDYIDDTINDVIEESQKNLEDAIGEIRNALNEFIESFGNAKAELENLKEEALLTLNDVNNILGDNSAEFFEGKLKESFNDPDLCGWVLGERDEDHVTISSLLLKTDEISSFVGEWSKDGANFEEVVSTFVKQNADSIKLAAVRASMIPYNEYDSNIRDYVLNEKTIDDLDPNLLYLCAFSPKEALIKYVANDVAEVPISKGATEFTVTDANSLKIKLANRSDIELSKFEIHLFKSTTSAYSLIKIDPESIISSVFLDERFAQTVIKNDLIQSTVADIARGQLGDFKITSDEILQRVGKLLGTTVASINLGTTDSEKEGTFNITKDAAYKLLPVEGIKYKINSGTFNSYDGGSLELKSGNTVTVLNTTEEDIEVNLFEYLGDELALMKVNSDQISALVSKSKDGKLEEAIWNITSDKINSIVLSSDSSGKVKNFSDFCQKADEIYSTVMNDDWQSIIDQKADNIMLAVNKTNTSNLFTGLLDTKGWELTLLGPLIVNPNTLEESNTYIITPTYNSFKYDNNYHPTVSDCDLDSGQISGEMVCKPMPIIKLILDDLDKPLGIALIKNSESWGSKCNLCSPEVCLKENQYYVLSWQGAYPECINQIAITSEDDTQYIIPSNNWVNNESIDTNPIYKHTFIREDRIHNLVFKSPIEGVVNFKFIFNDLDSVLTLNGEKISSVDFKYLKLEIGTLELNSRYTYWNTQSDIELRSRIVMTPEEIAFSVASAIGEEMSSITMTLEEIRTEVNGFIGKFTGEGAEFNGKVTATEFKVFNEEHPNCELRLTFWNNSLNNLVPKTFIAPEDGTPVIIAKVGDSEYILDMTKLENNEIISQSFWQLIKPTFSSIKYYIDDIFGNKLTAYRLESFPYLKKSLSDSTVTWDGGDRLFHTNTKYTLKANGEILDNKDGIYCDEGTTPEVSNFKITSEKIPNYSTLFSSPQFFTMWFLGYPNGKLVRRYWINQSQDGNIKSLETSVFYLDTFNSTRYYLRFNENYYNSAKAFFDYYENINPSWCSGDLKGEAWKQICLIIDYNSNENRITDDLYDRYMELISRFRQKYGI